MGVADTFTHAVFSTLLCLDFNPMCIRDRDLPGPFLHSPVFRESGRDGGTSLLASGRVAFTSAPTSVGQSRRQYVFAPEDRDAFSTASPSARWPCPYP